jgi:RNA polymerase sigma factor (sigma-70 family)
MGHVQLDGVLRHLGSLRDAQAFTDLPDAQLLEQFTRRHEEAAFAALVRRHGPMVWGVSRRVLPHVHDAEDVFQATFLILARRAASIRKAESVGSWLHGVAHHLALKVCRQRARRQCREKRAVDMRPIRPGGEISLSEVQAALDAALGALPEKYRSALVLCYLEGQTQEEAARHLGCPLATLRTRVARGRKLLRDRLTRYGLTLSTAGLAALLIASAAPAAAPAALVKAAVRASVLFAAGQRAAALCSQQAAALVAGGLRAMFLTKVKTVTALLLVVGLIGATAALTQRLPAAGGAPQPAAATSAPPPAAPPKPPAAQDKPNKKDIAYSGRVLGPDGKPVAGAKVYLTMWWGYHYEPFLDPESATTDRDGRFAFTAPRAKYQDQATVVAAAAPNMGVGWVGLRKDDKKTDLTLKLVADDVPIIGEIVNLEGKPVTGATLRLLQIMASPKEDLGPWLAAARDKSAPPRNRNSEIAHEHIPLYTTAPSAVVTTDAAGRFRLTGIGRERIVIVQLDGPGIASAYLHIRTRPGEPLAVGNLEADPELRYPRIDVTYYGSSFRHVAGPTKPAVGVIRDKDTKKPLANVTVRSEKLAHNPLHGIHIVQTVTDAQGRYRLTGLPKGPGNKINVVPPPEIPCISPVVDVPDSFGPDPETVNVELKRAVWVEGKLTDKATGQPLRCHVTWFWRRNNPNMRDYPGFYGGLHSSSVAATKEDGTYRVLGLPGPGQILVLRDHEKDYLHGAERDDEDGLKEDFGYMPQGNFAAFARVDPPKGVESVRRDIQLVRGWTFTGTVLGPDGKPLVGAVQAGDREAMKTAEFTARYFNPRRPRPVFFRYPAKGLVGLAPLPKEDGGSVTVRMVPGAAVTGRVVDLDGTPRAGLELWVSFRPKEEPYWDHWGLGDQIKTDQEGRFRIDALQPGFDYSLSADHTGFDFGAGLRAGATKDLGDIRIKRARR